MVKSKSANQSIELITLDTEDEDVLRIAREWYEHRPEKLTANQMATIVESIDVDELRLLVMEAQTYKVERIRHELIGKLNKLNEELGRSNRFVGHYDREDYIKRVFRNLNSDGQPNIRQSAIILRWRTLRKLFKELDRLSGDDRPLKIQEIFGSF